MEFLAGQRRDFAGNELWHASDVEYISSFRRATCDQSLRGLWHLDVPFRTEDGGEDRLPRRRFDSFSCSYRGKVQTARKVDGTVNISLQSAWKGEASELLGWGWSGAYMFEMTSLMPVVDCDDRAWAVMSSYFRLDPMLKKHSFSSCYCGVMSALLPAFGFRESPCR